MNNNIFNMDLTRTLPPALRSDPNIQALSKGIAEALQENARLIKNNIIYARIDELPEKLLDVLAYDLHMDWYDYDYPIDVKRELIKTSVRVHRKLGTVYAVETALGALHPKSEIEEWFDYGGEPFYFRIILDVSESRVQADSGKIIKTVKLYKRLTAHIEGLYYQCGVVIEIGARTEYFPLGVPLTSGRLRAGTESYRNTRAGIGNRCIDIETETAGDTFQSPQAGTIPYRNRIYRQKETVLEVDSGTDGMKFQATAAGKIIAGTEPQRNVRGGTSAESIAVEPEAAGDIFQSPQTGKNPHRNILFRTDETEVETVQDIEKRHYRTAAAGQTDTGTIPGRNITFNSADLMIEQETDTEKHNYVSAAAGETKAGTEPYRSIAGGIVSDDIEAEIQSENKVFRSAGAGTEPQRNITGGKELEEMQIAASAENHIFTNVMSGTVPETGTTGMPQGADIEPTAASEVHAYKTAYCGQKGLNRKNK